MGKLNKHSNLYKGGQLIRTAPLRNYTLAELEDLVDSLEKNTPEYNNAMAVLTRMYQANPKAQLEFLSKLQQNYTKPEEVTEALKDIAA